MMAIIDKLIHYAKIHLDLLSQDEIFIRNRLLELLRLDDYTPEFVADDTLANLSVPDVLLDELRKFIGDNEIVPPLEVERLVGAVIGTLSPLPSVVNQRFWHLHAINPSQATDYLYNLQVKNDYIKKTFVETNIHWIANFTENFLEITINMSKPEKRNEDIARLVKATPSGYPKCVLCAENSGYYGRDDHPNRTNLRTIDVTLDGASWFFQYSPYVYYDRHCIVIDYNHEPMNINRRNMKILLSFLDQFPHFFIGSNSDLPIVGGSILNHEHFQGGAHLLPIMHARTREEVFPNHFAGVSCHVLQWFNSTLLLKGIDKDQLLDAAEHIINTWRTYSDSKLDIISKTTSQHNTATLLSRKVENEYWLYIILRNNRSDERYPQGIFHAHPEYHHIKSEGIGLIEAGGLFILPSRLKRQLSVIEEGVKNHFSYEQIMAAHPDVAIHKTMINFLEQHRDDDVKKQITKYVNHVCRAILENTAVFKQDELGHKGWGRFLKEVNK